MNPNKLIGKEIRVLPIEYKDTEQRFWYVMDLFRPVNILMHIIEINEEEGTVTFGCDIPLAITEQMK